MLLAVCGRLNVMFNVLFAVCWLLFVVLVCHPVCVSFFCFVLILLSAGDCMLVVVFNVLLFVC